MLWAEIRWRGWQMGARLPPIGEADRTLLTFDQLGQFIGTFRRDESKRLSQKRRSDSIAEFAKTLARERVGASRRPRNDRTSRDRTVALAEAFQAPSVWRKILALRESYKEAIGEKKVRANLEKEILSFALALVTEKGAGKGRGRHRTVDHEGRRLLYIAAANFLDSAEGKIPKSEETRLLKSGLLKELKWIRAKNRGRLSSAEANREALRSVAEHFHCKPATILRSASRSKTQD
jgi:hypothetical protein